MEDEKFLTIDLDPDVLNQPLHIYPCGDFWEVTSAKEKTGGSKDGRSKREARQADARKDNQGSSSQNAS